ncbi:hypothetical protein [Halorientalis litorea]|jgi:glutamyl-tRNA reductase|uniref:hypothetical protein n=1 Tax=Halorientalis litorea TaxID=2931977 RepID=UPI001FF55E60|nr:hypothetical protein [Halorientalis litorea]
MSDADVPTEPAAAEATGVAAIEERATTVRDEQVQRAVATLDARGDVTPEKRAAVERLATRLTARLTAPAERALRQTGSGDDEVARVALALFGED